MIAKADLLSCKQDLEAHIGSRVRLKSNGGRKRTIIHEGILESCSLNVFTVRCPVSANYNEHVSFSYVDMLTKTVEVKFADEDDHYESSEYVS